MKMQSAVCFLVWERERYKSSFLWGSYSQSWFTWHQLNWRKKGILKPPWTHWHKKNGKQNGWKDCCTLPLVYLSWDTNCFSLFLLWFLCDIVPWCVGSLCWDLLIFQLMTRQIESGPAPDPYQSLHYSWLCLT